MNQTRLSVVTVLLASWLVAATACAADPSESRKTGSSNTSSSAGSRDKNSPSDDMPVTDPAYKLTRGDEVAVNVFNEGDMSTDQKIDNRGIIRIPYAGEVYLAGRTVRESEAYLEKLFVDKKLLRQPMVTVGVRGYASHEVSVLGAINGPGKFRMPQEASSVEILDVITGMGGFKQTAKSAEVKVTRTLDSGEEKVITVDVEAMINPRKADRSTPRSFLIYPGDRIFVAEKLW